MIAKHEPRDAPFSARRDRSNPFDLSLAIGLKGSASNIGRVIPFCLTSLQPIHQNPCCKRQNHEWNTNHCKQLQSPIANFAIGHLRCSVFELDDGSAHDCLQPNQMGSLKDGNDRTEMKVPGRKNKVTVVIVFIDAVSTSVFSAMPCIFSVIPCIFWAHS